MSYPSAPPPMGFNSPPVYPMQQAPIVFGPESITLTCPHCNCMVSTELSKSHKTITHLCCLLMFCSLGCSLFSCLPYFFCGPGSVDHSCPNCHAKLGHWDD